MRKSITQMADVGIELPKDILAYLLLFKFPPVLENLKQQIMHVEKSLMVNVVFNHLIQYNNKRMAQSKTKKTSTDLSLVSTKSRSNKDEKKYKIKCREGYHDPNAPHPKSSCFHLHPQAAPDWWIKQQNKWKNKTKKNPSINYHALLTLWINSDDTPNLILDSGANVHIFNNLKFFSSIDLQEDLDKIKTGKLEAKLKV